MHFIARVIVNRRDGGEKQLMRKKVNCDSSCGWQGRGGRKPTNASFRKLGRDSLY